MNAIKTVVTYVKLHRREEKLWKEIKRIEKQNKKLFDDNLMIRPNHQRLYATKKTLCGEVAATLMAEATVLGFEF